VVSKEDLDLAKEDDRLRRENRILKEQREILKLKPDQKRPQWGVFPAERNAVLRGPSNCISRAA